MSKLDKNIPKRFRLEYIFVCWQEEFERIAGRLVQVKVGGKRMLALESEQSRDILARSIYGPGIDAFPSVCIDRGSLGRTLGTFAWTAFG